VAVLRAQAFSLVAIGRNPEAAAAFRRALGLDPGLELDPEQVSPKIRVVFESVRRELPQREPPKPARVDTVYRRRPVPIAVIIPSAGQFHNGQRAKAWAVVAVGVASAAGAIGSHVAYDAARDRYLAATEPAAIADGYQDANNWYHARTITIGTFALTWLYSLVDAVLHL
jgi:hypothetical protein